MDIYILFLNGERYSQYKTEEESIRHKNNLLEKNPESKIKIVNEKYIDDFSYYDTKCRLNLVYSNE